MNTLEYLLGCIGEEGGEIAIATSKAVRFGLDDCHPDRPDGPTNRERLVDELNDLMGLIATAVDCGIIPEDWQSQAKMLAKQRRFWEFLNYSTSVGTHQPAGSNFSRVKKAHVISLLKGVESK